MTSAFVFSAISSIVGLERIIISGMAPKNFSFLPSRKFGMKLRISSL
jgi:hypothetical protein